MNAMRVEDLIAKLKEFDRQDEVFVHIGRARDDKSYYKVTALRKGLYAGKRTAEIIAQ